MNDIKYAGLAALKKFLKNLHNVFAEKNHTHDCADISTTASDNGKFLRVVDGAAKWTKIDNAEGVGF